MSCAAFFFFVVFVFVLFCSHCTYVMQLESKKRHYSGWRPFCGFQGLPIPEGFFPVEVASRATRVRKFLNFGASSIIFYGLFTLEVRAAAVICGLYQFVLSLFYTVLSYQPYRRWFYLKILCAINTQVLCSMGSRNNGHIAIFFKIWFGYS